MVGQKNKKKNKRTGSVERALVPSPVFAASPRSATTPAAMPPSTRPPASSSPHQRGPRPQSPEDEFSEPESSLFDYQHMDEAGYMTVGFGTWPARGRQVHREAERPQSGFRSSGLYAEPGDIQGFEDEDDKTVVKMISDIYATPVKKKTSRKSGVDDDKSMTGTQKDVRAEMKRIHDLPPEVNDVMSSSVRQPPHTSYNQPGSSQVPDSGRGSTRPGRKSL